MSEIMTTQDFVDGRLDTQTLKEAVNEDKWVTARLGKEFASVPMASRLLVENGLLGATPYPTYANMLTEGASLPNDSYAVVANDSTIAKNGFYQKISGTWVFLKWNPLAQSKDYTDSNALFKPQRLESTSLINNIKSAGIYHVPTAAIATSLGLPDAAEGQLYVSGNTQTDGTGYVFQTYINRNGNTYQRLKTAQSWTNWVGNYAGIASFNKNLNDFTEKGTYHAFTSGMATTAKNYPFIGAGGILTVMNDDSIIRQNYVSSKGTAQRFGITSSGVTTWQPWIGIEYDTNITKMSALLKEGSQAYKIVNSISEITGNLDTLMTAGAYFISTGSIASTTNGFPITGSGGFLDVKINASGAVHQRWTNINGYAYRWGSIINGIISWQGWRGFKSSNRIADLDAINTGKDLVVYGSSTMHYLTDAFVSLATRKNVTLKNYAVSGDTIAGAGLGSGTNKVTITVLGGQLVKDTYVPVTFTSTFGNYLRKLITLELSNGVIGTFDPESSAFYAQNIVGTMSVPTTEAFTVKSTWSKPENGVYIINIGKNNVSSTEDNSQFIIDKTVDIIDNLPFGSKFIVGGHFSDTNSTSIHRVTVESINKALSNKYGLKYFDINNLLFSDATWTKLGLTKTADDIAAINDRRLPPSLSRDTAHLSPAMSTELAQLIETKLAILGYIT